MSNPRPIELNLITAHQEWLEARMAKAPEVLILCYPRCVGAWKMVAAVSEAEYRSAMEADSAHWKNLVLKAYPSAMTFRAYILGDG